MSTKYNSLNKSNKLIKLGRTLNKEEVNMHNLKANDLKAHVQVECFKVNDFHNLIPSQWIALKISSVKIKEELMR